MPEISQAWLALIGAILGGSGLKALEHFLQRPKIKEDAAASFRKELREEVAALREELRKTEAELDIWRGKYYVLLEEYSKAKIDNAEALFKVQEKADQQMYSDTPQKDKGQAQEARNVAAKKLRDDG